MKNVASRAISPQWQQVLQQWAAGPAATALSEVCGAANAEARKKLMESNQQVYQALRDYLLWLFHNLCAYCQVDYRSATVQVEHFRPKSRVTGEKLHPGYYWLMFDSNNLLPSCSRCNNKKRNRFPVAGQRALSPQANLNAEQPLLLNPRLHKIEDHLSVIADLSDPRFGVIECVNDSLLGKESIGTYGLNDDEKIRARQLEMRAFLREFKDAFDNAAKRKELLIELRDGSRQFSFACAAMLNAWLEDLERQRRAVLDGDVEKDSVLGSH